MGLEPELLTSPVQGGRRDAGLGGIGQQLGGRDLAWVLGPPTREPGDGLGQGRALGTGQQLRRAARVGPVVPFDPGHAELGHVEEGVPPGRGLDGEVGLDGRRQAMVGVVGVADDGVGCPSRSHDSDGAATPVEGGPADGLVVVAARIDHRRPGRCRR